MSESPSIAGRAACILVVDDERDNRELLDVILAWEGFVVLTAANGEEALAMVKEHLPHLVLLDVMMPAMDGYQVAAKLKGDPGTAGIPIMLVTAMTDEKSRKLGRDCGASEFFAKPVDRDRLVLQVKKLLRGTFVDYRDA